MTAQIRHLGDPNLHFWLTRSIARAVDVNLSEALATGHLSVQSYTDLVTRCRKCQHVEKCQSWLAKHGGSAQAVPPHCPNADIINLLAANLNAYTR